MTHPCNTHRLLGKPHAHDARDPDSVVLKSDALLRDTMEALMDAVWEKPKGEWREKV